MVDGETGFLVPPASPAAYADRISSLLLDEDARQRMGARAFTRARALFSFERQLDRHIALYQRVQLVGTQGSPA